MKKYGLECPKCAKVIREGDKDMWVMPCLCDKCKKEEETKKAVEVIDDDDWSLIM